MQSIGKIILWIVIALLVLGGIYYWYSKGATQTPSTTTADQTTSANSTTGVVTLPSGSDTSDAALTQDFTAVDSQSSGMAADSAAIDAGMNDKPTSIQ